jgi:ferredoxin
MTADGTATAIDTEVPAEAADSAAEACGGCPAEAIEKVREYPA